MLVRTTLMVFKSFYRDLKCGRLACSGGSAKGRKTHVYNIGNVKCMVLSEDAATVIEDYGLVPDGILCGPEKVRRRFLNLCSICLFSFCSIFILLSRKGNKPNNFTL